jgi:hypothetical protein
MLSDFGIIDFLKDHGPLLSGAISCLFMLTVVPFLLLLVSMIGFLLSQNSELHSRLPKPTLHAPSKCHLSNHEMTDDSGPGSGPAQHQHDEQHGHNRQHGKELP